MALVARHDSQNVPQTFVNGKRVGGKPKPPDIAYVYRFLIVHV
jgi:hypothetical protein